MLFIKESNDVLLKHINIEEQQEVILTGIPSAISGYMQVRNGLNETVKLRSISLTDNAATTTKTDLNISWKLQPGERRMQQLHFSLPPQTAPGEYVRYLEMGGKKQKVTMVVQPNVEVDIFPTSFTLQDTMPGTQHSVVFTLTNVGNLPFQIPEIKHIAALDMDYLCRAFGFAFRDKKAVSFTETLNAITNDIKKNLTEWASTKVREAGKIVNPGNSMLVHLDFAIPKNADASNDYSGNIRFWNIDLSFVIKAHTEIKTKN
ncbi:MAG: hypothetical protein BGO40_01885 [Chryseobacterium sp. 39-10]|nr:hypothetical protein [Chryseobacterium sp.]OJV48294.1 MAG: hypothetical protein BGO40_01885 [Chryseobacterium sp. 39-10]